jgi:nucleotide-binding universal stress UspA family protein
MSPANRWVVVGFDGSAAAMAAVEWAARPAAPDGTVVAVHAFGPPPDWLGHPSYQRLLDEHRRAVGERAAAT